MASHQKTLDSRQDLILKSASAETLSPIDRVEEDPERPGDLHSERLTSPHQKEGDQ